jgi:transcriptional regulator with XRE-family HTH domain
MGSTSNLEEVTDRDLFYYRQRSKNRLFEALTSFFAEEAEGRGITKRDIAESLHRDPAQITRWLTAPSNLTLDTISDLLLSLGAEMDYSIERFKDRPTPNEMHDLIARVTTPRVTIQQSQTQSGPQGAPYRPLTPAGTTGSAARVRVTS